MNKAFENFFTEGENPNPGPKDNRITGKIIKVSDDGWGFIISQELKFTRIFFHWTSLKQNTKKFTELERGMKVTFTPVEVKDKGWRAIRIEVLPEKEELTHDETQAADSHD